MNKEVYKFMSQQTQDEILGWNKCKWCSDEYPLVQREKLFLEKRDILTSDVCFDCRIKSMVLWRNERKLFWKKSDKSGKKILSMFGDSFKGKVYDYEEWDSEEGFPDIYKELNSDDSPIDKYFELLGEVPKAGTDVFWTNENIWYCNRVGHLKNAYYSFVCFEDSEDIYFSYTITCSRDIYNSSNIYGSSLVAESVRVFDSYGIFYSDDIHESKDIYFSYDLHDCKDCIFSSNQVGKTYMVYNKQYTKEQYDKILKELLEKTSSFNSLTVLINKYEQLKKDSIKKASSLVGSEKCIGEQIQNSKDLLYSFGMTGCENGINSHQGLPGPSKNIFSSYGFGLVENMYYSTGIGPAINNYFCINAENTNNSYYSQKTKNCNDIAFCYGLQNQDYSILNKKYSKDEYFKKLKDIKGTSSNAKFKDFLSPDKSPYPINDTSYQELFPPKEIIALNNYNGGDYENHKDKTFLQENKYGRGILYVLEPDEDFSKAILDLGGETKIETTYRTKEKEINIPEGVTLIKANELEDNIINTSEDILKIAIICSETGRPFKIIQKELDFYKKHNLALSRIHPDQRINNRIERKPKIGLNIESCLECGIKVLTPYNSNRGDKIYCHNCYDKAVY